MLTSFTVVALTYRCNQWMLRKLEVDEVCCKTTSRQHAKTVMSLNDLYRNTNSSSFLTFARPTRMRSSEYYIQRQELHHWGWYKNGGGIANKTRGISKCNHQLFYFHQVKEMTFCSGLSPWELCGAVGCHQTWTSLSCRGVHRATSKVMN